MLIEHVGISKTTIQHIIHETLKENPDINEV